MSEWSEDEEKFLIENYDKMSDRSLSDKLDKTKSQVEKKRRRMNLMKGSKRGRMGL